MGGDRIGGHAHTHTHFKFIVHTFVSASHCLTQKRHTTIEIDIYLFIYIGFPQLILDRDNFLNKVNFIIL